MSIYTKRPIFFFTSAIFLAAMVEAFLEPEFRLATRVLGLANRDFFLIRYLEKWFTINAASEDLNSE